MGQEQYGFTLIPRSWAAEGRDEKLSQVFSYTLQKDQRKRKRVILTSSSKRGERSIAKVSAEWLLGYTTCIDERLDITLSDSLSQKEATVEYTNPSRILNRDSRPSKLRRGVTKICLAQCRRRCLLFWTAKV